MVKSTAVIFGVVFMAIGILGFVPAVAPDGMLLKIFHVNAAYNVVHLDTGIVALLCAMSGAGAARTFFRIFGIVYAIVAILGFGKGKYLDYLKQCCRHLATCRDRGRIALFRFRHGEADRLVFKAQRVRPRS